MWKWYFVNGLAKTKREQLKFQKLIEHPRKNFPSKYLWCHIEIVVSSKSIFTMFFIYLSHEVNTKIWFVRLVRLEVEIKHVLPWNIEWTEDKINDGIRNAVFKSVFFGQRKN